ncbi:hypothetical protein RHMOL_Rhmol01G0034600 [Rhododendron molle]|uniref:Uncharacterized protein n=1 Tax=Rhododendron molle TaxID=49168 RepID=A0ACC0Q0B4_RHOML|nr:hypothetical protein RHMOL_Rhmol01G0034600 [Rhododendron molle]
MAGTSPPRPRVVKAGFWAEGAADSFPPSAIDTKFFTHLYYAYVVPDTNTCKLVVSDPSPTATNLRDFTDTIRVKNPQVETLLTVGAWSKDGKIADVFARMAMSKGSRKDFIQSCIEVARRYDFHGIDLDWEFPRNPKDMRNLGKLFKEWRARVNKEAGETGRPKLLLTAAVASTAVIDYSPDGVSRSFPVKSINDNLDWVNVMCYDYCGYWSPDVQTGAPAALFNRRSVSTSIAFKSWIDEAGLLRSKFVMGLPLFGRTWTLQNPRLNGIGAAASAVGLRPGDDGKMSYSEVEKFNREKNATVVYDPETVSTYSYAGTSWIGYDDIRSTTVKIRHGQDNKIGGYFVSDVTGDQDLKISKQEVGRGSSGAMAVVKRRGGGSKWRMEVLSLYFPLSFVMTESPAPRWLLRDPVARGVPSVWIVCLRLFGGYFGWGCWLCSSTVMGWRWLVADWDGGVGCTGV